MKGGDGDKSMVWLEGVWADCCRGPLEGGMTHQYWPGNKSNWERMRNVFSAAGLAREIGVKAGRVPSRGTS